MDRFIDKNRIPIMRFEKFKDEWKPSILREKLKLESRPVNMDDEEDYELITVKRRYGGIVSRGKFKGKNVLVKSQFRIKRNDFVISKRQICHNACGLVPQNLDNSIVSNEYSVFVPKSELDIVYFDYFCKQVKVSHSFYLSSIGVHIEKMLFKVDDWLKWKFLFPSLPEQQKIASFLSIVDNKIVKLSHKKVLLEKYKKGVIQRIFSQEIIFKDNNENEFPEWEEKSVRELCEIVGGGTPDTTNPEYWDGDIPWFTPTEICKKYLTSSVKQISESGLKKSSAKLLPQGTILFTSRATIGEIGFCLNECTTNQGFQSFIVNKRNCPEFIYYLIKYNQKEFLRRAQGSTFLEISKKELLKIKFKVPIKENQEKIAGFLSGIDKKIESVDKQLSQMKNFKKGLLQKMFV